jgi:hypothetical protein
MLSCLLCHVGAMDEAKLGEPCGVEALLVRRIGSMGFDQISRGYGLVWFVPTLYGWEEGGLCGVLNLF